MKNNLSTDGLYYKTIIKEALPYAMVIYCENFNDVYCGWDICPVPGVLIRFGVYINDNMLIKLTKYQINIFDETCKTSQIYFGIVPADDNSEPDFEFIKQMLRNWQSVGG